MKSQLNKYAFTDPTNVTQYKSEEGIFFIIIDGVVRSYATCRDSIERRCQEFLAQSTDNMKGKTLQIGFKCAKTSPEKLKAFWKPIFKQLGKDSVVLFHTCNIEGCIVVNTRKFWMQNQITRSVFTMLLRASCVYDSFAQASTNYYLMKDTMPALNHFLQGNIIPTFQCGNYNQSFYSYFRNQVNPDLNKLLVKPKA